MITEQWCAQALQDMPVGSYVVNCVNIAAKGQQRFHHRHVVPACSFVESCVPLLGPVMHASAQSNQMFNDLSLPCHCGFMQYCPATYILQAQFSVSGAPLQASESFLFLSL